MSKELNLLDRSFVVGTSAPTASPSQTLVPFYVRLQVSPFEAQAALLLHSLVTKHHHRSPYKTFFCSSRLEALSGALKVVRHNHLAHPTSNARLTAVYDPTGLLEQLYDPLQQGVDSALVPGLRFTDSESELSQLIANRDVFSVVITDPRRLGIAQLDALLTAAKNNQVSCVLDESAAELTSEELVSSSLETAPDVIVLGENLTNHQAPSGCFMMSDEIYGVWNTFGNYNLHSNTWGGNSLTMSWMLGHLMNSHAYRQLAVPQRQKIESIAGSHRQATKTYAKYCNPKLTTMVSLSSLNKDIVSASSTGLEIRCGSESRRVIDAAGTYGVNLRGHNPTDYDQNVIRVHEPEHDYWNDLEEVFEKKTGLSHLLPAVSGTSANDIAISMALLAKFPKRRIVAMEMGYHGKTLISLAATYKQRIRAPFAPLYPHVSFVDPLSDRIEEELTALFETGDVALVSLETVQGEGGVRSCPQRLCDFLTKNRERFGYLISVDEVQTGMYRTGRFMNHQGKIAHPDLLAVGKGMSDMMFPVAAAAVSDSVFQLACARNEVTVRQFVNMYRCQLGAHTALHAIRSADDLQLADRAKEIGDYFRNELQKIAGDTGMVKEVRGEGLMIGFELAPDSLPKLLRGSFGGLLASRFANDSKCPVLVAFNPDKPHLIRFLPPLTITREEIDAVLDTTRRCMKYGLRRLVTPLVANLVKPSVWFPDRM